MPKGGARKGAGRPRGSTSKHTRKLADEAAEKGLSPMAYALAVLNDPNESAGRRDTMCALLMPYCHPRLAAESPRPPVVNQQLVVNVVPVPSGTFFTRDQVDEAQLEALPALIDEEPLLN